MEAGIQKYIAFLAAVECGSFTGAAEKLSYSQSGVSRMIGDLEKEWHTALLERSHGGITLTSDGKKLLPYIERLCRAHRALCQEAQDLTGLRSGLIRIGAFSSVTIHWLPSMIGAFQKDYPHIEYEFLLGSYEEIEAWAREGRVDFGFTRFPAPSDLEGEFLEEDPLTALVPLDHPLAGRETISLHEMEADPFLLVEREGQSEVSELVKRWNFHPRVRYTMWDDQAVMAMVEKGMGISISTRLVTRRCPYRVAVRPLAEGCARPLGVVLKSRRGASLAVRRFLEYLPFRNG